MAVRSEHAVHVPARRRFADVRVSFGHSQAPLLAALFGLSLGLRLIFAFGPSRIRVIWDAAAYWGEAERIRTSLCATLHVCHPATGAAHAGIGDTTNTVVFSKSGLLPLVQGTLMTILPNSPTTAQVLFALLDATACVMVAAIVLRLGGPWWVAVTAGLIDALYVPGIIGDASFLEQPLIRFGLIAWAFAEVYAFTAPDARRRHLFVGLATASLLVVAFSSESTRPLLWLLPAAAIGLAMITKDQRALARDHLAVCAGIAATVVVAAAVIAVLPAGHSFAEALTNLALGLSTSGTATGQVTVLGFAHFWPSDAWTYFKSANGTQSLLSDFRHAPVRFTKLWAYSTYLNWRYPDFLYFQHFVLGVRAQTAEHLAVTVPGFVGLAWLTGQAGARRALGVIALVAIAITSVIAGVVDVEPRRVGAVMPFLALGAACAVWSIAHRRTRRSAVSGAIAIVACAAAWALPLPRVISIGLAPADAHTALVVCRLVTTALVCAWLVRDWHGYGDFRALTPAVVLGVLLVLFATSESRDSGWRSWTTTLHTPIRQEVRGLSPAAGRYPWLIADFGSPDDAASAAIYVNGRLVKPAGARAMRPWQVDGGLLGWRPYADLEQMSDGRRPHTWMALPLPRSSLGGQPLTIDVLPQQPVAIGADYIRPGASEFPGPALTPWFEGLSLWRWLANGRDPRIPWTQRLDARYTSARWDGGRWRTDIAAGGGTGLYRVYVLQEPFGRDTNALGESATPPTLAPHRCRSGQDFATTAGRAAPYLCVMSPRRLALYTAAGKRIGDVSTAALTPRAVGDTTVATLSSEGASAEIVHAVGPIFVANVLDADGHLAYSLAFSYPAIPPIYL
ncbi:MAG: hypothetical protein ACJ77E_03130 [Gaiellaceae bacterium]